MPQDARFWGWNSTEWREASWPRWYPLPVLSSLVEDSQPHTPCRSLPSEPQTMSLPTTEPQLSELQSVERERMFDAFRRWGYLDANLNPFGGTIAGGYAEI